MSIKAGPRLISNGLIFDLDAGNYRSYIGSGITAYSLVSGVGATLVNGVGFGTTNKGYFIFDGSNDYIISPSISNYSFGLNDFTISAWFKSSDKSRYSCIANFYGGSSDGIILYSNITNGYFRTWIGNFLTIGNIDITNGQWNNVVLKRSSGTCTQFVNGLQNITASASVNIGNYNLKIGGIPPSNYYANGSISQIQVYNRALTAQEILQNYNATKGRYGL
jgi:hypothetical protein